MKKIISKNPGKILEDNWRKSIPKDVLYYRPPDQSQAYNMTNKLRFSMHSPCDCMIFNGNTATFYTLELKSVATNSMSFENSKDDKGVIHKHQLDSLEKFSNYTNVVSGFILDFRKSGITYFVEIGEVIQMINHLNKKSFNEKDLLIYCSPIIIEKKKLKVNFKYDVEKFLNDTRLT